VKRVGILAVLVLAVAACGSSGTTLYTKQATRACLKKQGLTPKGVGDDFVASSATGGAFRVAVHGNSVAVSFGETLDDARKLDDAYRRFAAPNVGVEDILRDEQNAVMLWRNHPQDAQLATITGCLKK
jgi:hypothetical protein